MKANYTLDGFLQSLYSDPEEDAIDLAYSNLSRLINTGDMIACGITLAELDVTRLTPAVIASILTVTASASRHIPERARFYSRARQHLDTMRDPADNERLLHGL